MRLVFVNHCHPDTPHVCATRVRAFAEACTRAGHQVVLLTETLPGQPSSVGPGALAGDLGRHDWSRPYHLACAPVPGRMVARLREGWGPRCLRRPLLAGAYVARSGLFTDWRDGSRPYWPVLARAFAPDAAWGTFGNTDAWAIARGIARLSGCRWVADLKDPWSVFVPGPLRALLAARFADAAGFTALSAAHAEDAARWIGRPATVVYSGIDDGFLPPPPPVPAEARMLLVGGLYADKHLALLVEGISRWLDGASGPVVITHAGGEGARFLAAARPLAGRARLEAAGFVDLPRLRALAAGARALLYVRNPAALYQHKLVELLALDRPVLCLPPEGAEAGEIADDLGATLLGAADADGVAAGLHRAMGAAVAVDRTRLAAYTWDAQAARLLEALS